MHVANPKFLCRCWVEKLSSIKKHKKGDSETSMYLVVMKSVDMSLWFLIL